MVLTLVWVGLTPAAATSSAGLHPVTRSRGHTVIYCLCAQHPSTCQHPKSPESNPSSCLLLFKIIFLLTGLEALLFHIQCVLEFQFLGSIAEVNKWFSRITPFFHSGAKHCLQRSIERSSHLWGKVSILDLRACQAVNMYKQRKIFVKCETDFFSVSPQKKILQNSWHQRLVIKRKRR